MPKDQTRKGHFIPRFLLRNFTTRDNPEHIWAVKKIPENSFVPT
jgi:hypothetical protein